MHILSPSRNGMASYAELDENSRLSLSWNLNREISKLNYHIHTDAIKGRLILPELTQKQRTFIYADEADLLNVALFGMTAKEWRDDNPDKKGNIRDNTAETQLQTLLGLDFHSPILLPDSKDKSPA